LSSLRRCNEIRLERVPSKSSNIVVREKDRDRPPNTPSSGKAGRNLADARVVAGARPGFPEGGAFTSLTGSAAND
jgi:hypothetical protein